MRILFVLQVLRWCRYGDSGVRKTNFKTNKYAKKRSSKSFRPAVVPACTHGRRRRVSRQLLLLASGFLFLVPAHGDRRKQHGTVHGRTDDCRQRFYNGRYQIIKFNRKSADRTATTTTTTMLCAPLPTITPPRRL